MPIEVRHEGNDAGLNAAIEFLLAQTQQQQAQQARQAPASAIAQLAPILASRSAAQSQQQPASYAIPGSGVIAQPQPRSDQPQYVRPQISQPADHSASVARSLLAGDHQADRLANQDQLAQFRADQQLQRLDERNAQQNQLEQMRSADDQMRAAQHDLPNWIIQGVQSGKWAYSPSQLQEMQQRQDAIAKVDSDPRFNPAEKAQFKANQFSEIRRIQMSPTPVPPDKWPVTPQQQLENSTVMKPVQLDPSDPNNVIQLPMVPVQRAGGVKWELTPDGEMAKQVALQNLKHNQAVALEQIRQANKPKQETPEDKEARAIRAAQRRALDADEMKSRQAANKAEIEFKKAQAALEALPADYDATQRSKLQAEVEAKREAMNTAGSQWAVSKDRSAENSGEGLMTGTQPFPPPSNPDDSNYDNSPPPAPPLSDHPEDGPAQWSALPIGALTTLPNGNTVRKTGNTSFESVGDNG